MNLTDSLVGYRSSTLFSQSLIKSHPLNINQNLERSPYFNSQRILAYYQN